MNEFDKFCPPPKRTANPRQVEREVLHVDEGMYNGNWSGVLREAR